MRSHLFLALLIALCAAIPGSRTVEKRCGWIDNPTPANWWIVDRDGTWTFMMQGSYEATGIDHIPSPLPGEYVETNVHYGYYCGCMDVVVDPETLYIHHIYGGEALPLETCDADPHRPDRTY